MTSSIKDIAKIGLRNPYLIEIYAYEDKKLEEFEPFAIENMWNKYSSIKEMKLKIEF